MDMTQTMKDQGFPIVIPTELPQFALPEDVEGYIFLGRTTAGDKGDLYWNGDGQVCCKTNDNDLDTLCMSGGEIIDFGDTIKFITTEQWAITAYHLVEAQELPIENSIALEKKTQKANAEIRKRFLSNPDPEVEII